LSDKTEQRLKPYSDRIKIYVYYQIKGHYPKLVLFDIMYNLFGESAKHAKGMQASTSMMV